MCMFLQQQRSVPSCMTTPLTALTLVLKVMTTDNIFSHSPQARVTLIYIIFTAGSARLARKPDRGGKETCKTRPGDITDISFYQSLLPPIKTQVS